MEVLNVVFVVFFVAHTCGGGVDVDHGTACTVNGLVGKDLAGQVVAVSVHGREPPHGLERHHLLDANLLMNRSRQLSNVFEAAFFKEFQDLPVPLVVFEGVNLVIGGFDEIREHPVGERHGRDGDGSSTLGIDHVQA